MRLLSGRYDPITDAIGFLEADFAQVVAADGCWRAALGGYHARPVRGPLPSLLEPLLPLTGPLLRYVWVQTAGMWTAYFDNSVLGSDTFGPVSYLAQQLGCRGGGNWVPGGNGQARGIGLLQLIRPTRPYRTAVRAGQVLIW